MSNQNLTTLLEIIETYKEELKDGTYIKICQDLKQRFDKAGGASELGMSFTNFKNMYKGPYYLGEKYSVSGKKK